MLRIAFAIALLGMGLASYWFFRPGIYLFHWLHLPVPSMGDAGPVPLYILLARNHLADALWCIATFQIAVFFKTRAWPGLYSHLLIALPFTGEAAQAAGLLPGVFDWLDLLLYLIIYFITFHRGAFTMQRTKQHIAGIAAVSILTAGLIGSGGAPTYVPPPAVYETGTFTIQPKPDETFTKPSLKSLVKASKSLSIVLRVPAPRRDITSEESQIDNVRYNTIEKEFAKAGYTVRDRALFAKVLEQENLDYSKIGELTQTDLILELVRFAKEGYPVTSYKDSAGASKVSAKEVVFTGATVEFRLVSVKANDLVGAYTFNYTPCVNGCTHTFSQTVQSTLRANDYIPDDFFKNTARRLIQELESAR